MSTKKETKLRKYMKVPLKMVVKARDLYIQSMNQLSSHDLGGGMSFGMPVYHVSALPRSFSASHSQTSKAKEERLAELVRAASARTTTVDTPHGPSTKMRKAKSVRSGRDDHHGFERIDETSPLINFASNHKMTQRSKSYSVAKYTYTLQ